MNPTLFVELVAKWFGAMAKRFVEKVNGDATAPKYLFKTMLRPELSPDLKWDSLSVNSSIVAADVVALDSELPLKKRDVIASASGTIPKIGMKMHKSEKLLTDIQILRARGASEAEIARKLFEDTPKVIGGIWERLEYMFLKALSTGTMLVPQEENVGTGVRVSFNYLNANKFGVSKSWDVDGAAPISDMSNVIEAAAGKGDIITSIMLDRATYNELRKSSEAKTLYAASIGYGGTPSIIPTPSAFDAIILDELKVKLIIVERTVRIEKNGVQTPVKPFAANTLVFLTSENVGTLTYGILAEEGSPVAGVTYQKVDSYILVSKYSKNDPLAEFTSSQALVIPVLENVSSIYLMDTRDAQAVSASEVEGDANVTIWGAARVKTTVISAFKSALNVTVAANISDAKLIDKVNALSAEDEATLKTALGIA